MTWGCSSLMGSVRINALVGSPMLFPVKTRKLTARSLTWARARVRQVIAALGSKKWLNRMRGLTSGTVGGDERQCSGVCRR